MPPRKLRAVVGVDVTLLGSRLRNTSDTARTGRRQRLGAPRGIRQEPANDQPGNADDGDTQEGLREAPSPTYCPVFRSSSHDEPISPAVQPVSPRYRVADVKLPSEQRAPSPDLATRSFGGHLCDLCEEDWDSRRTGQPARCTDAGATSYHLLDLTVYGRQEGWEDSPADWQQLYTPAGEQFRTDGRPTAQWSRLA
jgi:hypothetical protein